MFKNQLLKNTIKVLLLFSVISSTGCSSLLLLRRSASENVLLSIKTNNASVSYFINSDLEDRIIKDDIIIPFNRAFKDNVDDYIRTKFNTINQENANYQIYFELKSLDIDYRYSPDFGSAILGGLAEDKNALIGNGFADIKVMVNVKIKRGEQIIGDKNIISTTNFTKEVRSSNRYVHKKETYEEGLNEALNKTVILIDKYLISLNI